MQELGRGLASDALATRGRDNLAGEPGRHGPRRRNGLVKSRLRLGEQTARGAVGGLKIAGDEAIGGAEATENVKPRRARVSAAEVLKNREDSLLFGAQEVFWAATLHRVRVLYRIGGTEFSTGVFDRVFDRFARAV